MSDDQIVVDPRGTVTVARGSVGDDFPREQARCRTVLGIYRDCGPAGAFAVTMIEATLREADASIASGDLVRILAAYQAMRGWKV